MSEEIIEIKPLDTKAILDEVVDGARAHSVATRLFMNQFEFYGKSLYVWLEEMTVHLPERSEITPAVLQEKYIELARKYQRAANYYTIASAIHGGLISGGEIKKSDLVRALVNNHNTLGRKRPAASILERMADSYMNSTAHTKVASRIVKDFWKERKETLSEMRKCFENLSISVATEMKYQD